MTAVYAIEHVSTKRCYVGSALDVARRWDAHRSMLRRGIHDNTHLQNAWNAYGSNEFAWKILEVVDDVESLLGREQFWMDSLCALEPLAGFNVCSRAGSRRGIPHSAATKKRIAASQRGRKHRPETIAKMKSHKGRERSWTKLSEADVVEIKARLRAGETQNRVAVDYRVARSTIGAIRCGVIWEHVGGLVAENSRWRPGRHLSDETKAKIGNAHRGMKRSAEARANMRAGHLRSLAAA